MDAAYHGLKALIVDDDPDCLLQMRLFLERLGFQVMEGSTQAEGESLIASMTPDLAVFDLMLEHHDSGFVLAHRLKQRHPTVPVILVTGVTSETGFRFSEAGPAERSWIKADAILDKGIRFDQLRREVDRLLRPPATEDAPRG